MATNAEIAVSIPVNGNNLEGTLRLPKDASLIVVFVHGSGSSRLSPRNIFVAEYLYQSGIGTLLFDLLTESEDETYQTRFDIDLLVGRLLGALDWLQTQNQTQGLRIGLFGASTGAAAALEVAAQRPQDVVAIVSRGGRTDLADKQMSRVVAPTLFIVGGADDDVLTLNQTSFAMLGGPKELAIIPGATHLFEEPGALEEVAALSTKWFRKYA